MASLALGVKFNPTLGGLTDWVYSSAVTGYVGPAASNPAMVDGKIYRYRAESADLSQWEYGYGVYTASTQTIARTTIQLSSTGSKVSFSAPPFVGIVPFPADVLQFDDAMSLTTAQQAQAQRNIGSPPPVAGSVRNLKIVRGSATTLTITADEIVTETALGGPAYRQAGASHTLTISGTGANGMDTGSAPTSGWLAVYSITKGDGSTFAVLGYSLGVFASGTVAPTIYPGANMPAGYVASALIGIWPTNGSAQIPTGAQIDRKFYWTAPVQVVTSSTGVATLTSLSITSAVPASARACDLVFGSTNGAASSWVWSFAADASGTGLRTIDASGALGSNVARGPLSFGQGGTVMDVLILTAQTIFWQETLARANDNVWVTAFTF